VQTFFRVTWPSYETDTENREEEDNGTERERERERERETVPDRHAGGKNATRQVNPTAASVATASATSVA